MRYISLGQVLELHRRIIEQSGGTPGMLNIGELESAVQQPRMTFGGEDLYTTLGEKAAALAFSIIRNHPFIDGAYLLYGQLESEFEAENLDVGSSHKLKPLSAPKPINNKLPARSFSRWDRSIPRDASCGQEY